MSLTFFFEEAGVSLESLFSLLLRPEVVVFPRRLNLTYVTSAQRTNGCLVASVIALVGSWKILLHTPIDPPTAGTAASSPQEQR